METGAEGTVAAAQARPLRTICLRRRGAGGLLWRVATLGEPHRLLFVLTRPLMPGRSLAVAGKAGGKKRKRNEM